MFKNKKIYDISMSITQEMLLYPGTEPVQITEEKKFKEDGYNLTSLSLSTHTGTHLDAPLHFIDQGKEICDFSVNDFMISVQVVNIKNKKEIKVSELEEINFTRNNILFKTVNSKILDDSKFDKSYVGLTEESAEYLISKEIKFIGIDYLSVGKHGIGNQKVHRMLLQNEILLLEGVDLSDIVPGEFTLIALPLKLEGAEGSPVRAVLIE